MMTMPNSTQDRGVTPPAQLIHSIHNTSRSTTKAVLVQRTKLESAIDQFSNIANILKNNIEHSFHGNVFVPGTEPALTGRQANSIFSCNSSSYASTLLNNLNPQDGEGGTYQSAPKRTRPMSITYSTAVTSPPLTLPSQTTISTLTDMDKLYESMSARFGEQFGSKVSIQDLEKQVSKTSTEISTIRTNFEQKLTSLQSSVDQLMTKVNMQYSEINNTVQSLVDTIAKQNFIIAGIQQDFKLSMETLSNQLLVHPTNSTSSSSTSSPRRPLKPG
jgi:hypothetical protein